MEMFHCLKINQLLAPSGRCCFSHTKGFWGDSQLGLHFLPGRRGPAGCVCPRALSGGEVSFPGWLRGAQRPQGRHAEGELSRGRLGCGERCSVWAQTGNSKIVVVLAVGGGWGPTRASHRDRWGDRTSRIPGMQLAGWSTVHQDWLQKPQSWVLCGAGRLPGQMTTRYSASL